MQEIFLLALVTFASAALATIFLRLRQPLLVTYLAVGAGLSAVHLVKPEQLEFLAFLPEIGLAFLLFLVGMELDLSEFRSLGKKVLLATVLQVAVTTAVIGGVLSGVGWGMAEAALVGAAISFSSTILVVKLLLERREITSMHGKLSVGILLVEDLLAVSILMAMTIVGQGESLGIIDAGLVAIKGIVLIVVALLIGRKVLPRVFGYMAQNLELLFLAGISWCLLFVSVTTALGFSLAIGAFLAGVSIGQSVYRVQISTRIKPLRDFFIMLFFVNLGTGLSITGISSQLLLAIAILGYAVIIKPVVFLVLFTRFGFRARSSWQTGIYLSSVSEFSLIILAAGAKEGILPQGVLSPAIFGTVLSFVLSSFLVTHQARVYRFLEKGLRLLETKERVSLERATHNVDELTDHAILVGCHRSGTIILRGLQRVFGERLVVVDFNPDVVAVLREQFVPALYGDATDPEVLEKLVVPRAKLLVSTVRDLETNLALLDTVSKENPKAVVLMTAADAKEAVKLYEGGAEFVSLPLTLEGTNLADLIVSHQRHLETIGAERERKLAEARRLAEMV